jgi:hypothetical protein
MGYSVNRIRTEGSFSGACSYLGYIQKYGYAQVCFVFLIISICLLFSICIPVNQNTQAAIFHISFTMEYCMKPRLVVCCIISLLRILFSPIWKHHQCRWRAIISKLIFDAYVPRAGRSVLSRHFGVILGLSFSNHMWSIPSFSPQWHSYTFDYWC